MAAARHGLNLYNHSRMQTVTIDAEGKKLGRIASEAASYLLGKRTPAFAKNKVEDISVHIVNAGKLSVTERKLTTTTYVRYSGYPGGLKSETLAMLRNRKGYKEALKIAVSGMLPKNKLRTKRLQRLTISE